MPLTTRELCQLIYFDEIPITHLRAADILVHESAFYHVASVRVEAGTWYVTSSHGEHLEGRVRTSAGPTRVLRIPVEWLTRDDTPLVLDLQTQAPTPTPIQPSGTPLGTDELLDLMIGLK